jgi:hypothetical protein
MNKHFSTVVSLLIASMVVLSPLSAAGSNSLSNSLNAYFTSIDDSGCVTTEVSITAHSSGLSVKNPGKSPDKNPNKNIDKSTGGGVLFVDILRINECQGKVILHANGRKGLGSERLQIASAQGTATLKLPIKIIDPGSGKPLDADINLTWIGSGDPPVTVERSRYFDEPGQLITAARPFKQTFQSAQASGSVSINGENFTPELSQDASILLYGS